MSQEYYENIEQLIEHLQTRHPRSIKKHGIQKLLKMAEALA